MDTIGFSEWLQIEMDRQGLSQSDLVRSSGLSNAHISRILSMQSSAGPRALEAIAKGLRLPPELVYQKARLLETPITDASIDILATEVSTILLKLPQPDREIILDLARILYARQKRIINPNDT
jgi:transcriptional regulator with XRE-family HTH domain